MARPLSPPSRVTRQRGLPVGTCAPRPTATRSVGRAGSAPGPVPGCATLRRGRDPAQSRTHAAAGPDTLPLPPDSQPPTSPSDPTGLHHPRWRLPALSASYPQVFAAIDNLFDLFVKHFSQKSLTRDLVKTRAFIEENIDPIIKELEALKGRGETTGYDSLLHRILMHDMDLQREGVPLLASTREKLHSILIAE